MYRFGDVCVDLRRLAVTRAGEPVELEPKAFDVLRYLLENADRLVTKDELMETVWRYTFVTPNVLTRAVAQLRRTIGDDAREARYVETVARRGYRFIAPVVSETPLPVTLQSTASPAVVAVATASARGIHRIMLEVRESNLAARRLYEKLGFSCDGERSAYYRNPVEKALLYSIRL